MKKVLLRQLVFLTLTGLFLFSAVTPTLADFISEELGNVKVIKSDSINPSLAPTESPFSGIYMGTMGYGTNELFAVYVREYSATFIAYQSFNNRSHTTENVLIEPDGSFTSSRGLFQPHGSPLVGTFTPSRVSGKIGFSNFPQLQGRRSPSDGSLPEVEGYYLGTYSGTLKDVGGNVVGSPSGEVRVIVNTKGEGMAFVGMKPTLEFEKIDAGFITVHPDYSISGTLFGGTQLSGTLNPIDFNAEGTLTKQQSNNHFQSGNWSFTRLSPVDDEDNDDDGVPDVDDPFPNDPTETADTDGDGVGDNSDAFPDDSTETADTDGDGTGDNADPDADNDGVLDVNDALPLDPTETVDSDGDGLGDNSDIFPVAHALPELQGKMTGVVACENPDIGKIVKGKFKSNATYEMDFSGFPLVSMKIQLADASDFFEMSGLALLLNSKNGVISLFGESPLTEMSMFGKYKLGENQALVNLNAQFKATELRCNITGKFKAK